MLIYDRQTQITKREITDEGFLKVTARISRAGIYRYTRHEVGLDGPPNELVSIYRDPKEVFDEESMRSFALKPVTDNHPPEFVNPVNFKSYAIGYSGEQVFKDGDYVATTVVITDAQAIKNVMAGKVELSPGYTLEFEAVKGMTIDGQAYDGVQSKIRGNHIALVGAGRCGSECRLADHAHGEPCEDEAVCDCASCKQRKEDRMTTATTKTIQVDGMAVEVTDAAAQAIDRLQKQRDEARERVQKLTDQVYENRRQSDDQLAVKDAEIAKLKAATAPAAITALADERVNLMARALPYVPNDYDFTGKTNVQIARDCVVSMLGADAVQNRTDEYILAQFDTLVQTASANDGTARLSQAVLPAPRGMHMQQDDTGALSYQQRLTQAWMSPDLRKNYAQNQ